MVRRGVTLVEPVRNVMPRYVARYWGKARPGSKALHQWHPLAWHSLDVAACVQEILRGRPRLLECLVRALGPGATPDGALSLAILLAAGHDVGKFGDPFQAQAPDACALIGSKPVTTCPATGDWRHDNVGLLAWLEGGIAEALGLDMAAFDVLPKLASASACHHGRPTDAEIIEYLPRAMTVTAVADACDFVKAFRCLIENAPFIPLDEFDAARASFILAGVINVADWVGSEAPYASPNLGMAEYWQHAQQQSRDAVARVGLCAARPRHLISFAGLFPGRSPTPLQMLADTMVLPAGPVLIMVDETTGAGKTEAADTLTGRMIASGHAEGIFLGMPTTATTDAQATRHSLIRSLLFEESGTPTMMIAHSRAVDGLVSESDRERQAWLADDRRRRLLSDLCVGTIDQALLAALPTKFSVVRLLGLIGKVLVVDEAHSYDDYTSALIEALLEFHAAMGGSAILLSATLPKQRKSAFARAFVRGAKFPDPVNELLDDNAYPLVTVVSQEGTRLERPRPAPRAPKDRRVVLVHSIVEAARLVLKAARSGKCVAWIRNTVDQSIETGRALKAQHEDVTILHSRFPDLGRERITQRILSRFGRNSTAKDRCGGVIVATAVIEQSLDLDFDLVVVDLKEIEGILQSGGRQQRHSRDLLGNPLEDGAPDQRPETAMIVVAPDPEQDLDREWYSRLLGRATFVHRDTGALWRTASVLARDGWIRYSTMRNLVESVRDPNRFGMETPQVFDAASDRVAADKDTDVGLVKNAIRNWRPEIGYIFRNALWDDEKFPTREGTSIEVILTQRRHNGDLAPLYTGHPWIAGRLRLRINQVEKLSPLENKDIPAKLRTVCPYTKIIEVLSDGRGTGFQLTEFAGLEFIGG